MTDTASLIQNLARQAGAQSRREKDFGWQLLPAMAAALALACCIIALLFHARLSWHATLLHFAFWAKITPLGLLAAGGFAITRQQGIPGSSHRARLALLPGLALPLALALAVPGAEPLTGWDASAVPECFFAILLAAIPALAILLRGLRRGVVTRPAAAGAAAGLLAGALGAAAYAMACRNDGACFVLVWYGAAIAVMCLLGALSGRRALRW